MHPRRFTEPAAARAALPDYTAPWWLPGGNLQTIWPAVFARRSRGLPPAYRRERWTAPDGDFVDVDWLVTTADTRQQPQPQHQQPSAVARPVAPAAAGSAAPPLGPDSRPLLVLFHGLEGSSRSHYAQAFADVAQERGWAYAVPHFRGCSGELNLAPRAYHSGDHEEIDWILRRFRAAHAGPLLAVGISLGGNALMRWAAEAGHEAAAVAAAVASVCSPLDLAAGGHAIGRGFNRQVYTRMFLASMKPRALAKLAQHPGLFDRERLRAARDLYDFDDVFTGPLHGFRGVDDYWERASAKPHLHRIRIPALAVNARNDPFIPAASLPRAAEVGPCVRLWQPAGGGHVGFARGRPPGDVRGMPEAVAGWFAASLAGAPP